MPRSRSRKPRKPAAVLGEKGGRARADRLPAARRQQIAQRAARTRWQGPQSPEGMPGKRDATVGDVVSYYSGLPGFVDEVHKTGTPLLTAIMKAHADAVQAKYPDDPEALKEIEHIRDLFLKSTEGRVMASLLELEARQPEKPVRVWKRSRGSDDRIAGDQNTTVRGPGWYYDAADDTFEESNFFTSCARGPFDTKSAAQAAATREFEVHGYTVTFVAGEPKLLYTKLRKIVPDFDPYLVIKHRDCLVIPYLRGGGVHITDTPRKQHGTGFVVAFEPLTTLMHNSGRLYDWLMPGMTDTITAYPVDPDVIGKILASIPE